MPSRRLVRKRPTSKRLAARRRATPKQPRKVRRRVAAHARVAAAKAGEPKPRKAPGKRVPAAPMEPAPGKLRVALFGATGLLGSRIAAEAAGRGHLVTPVQRSPGFAKVGAFRVGVRRADATSAESVAAVAKGHDAVVSAVAPPPMMPELLVRAARGLVAGCRAAGVPRLLVVNGAGSLLVEERDRDGAPRQLVDTPAFPKDWRPVAAAHRDALGFLRDAGAGLDWTAISPPALVEPGVRTGRYQIGTERLLRGRDGQSRISAEDYAVAVVDELEKGRFKGKRMTVAWP